MGGSIHPIAARTETRAQRRPIALLVGKEMLKQPRASIRVAGGIRNTNQPMSDAEFLLLATPHVREDQAEQY